MTRTPVPFALLGVVVLLVAGGVGIGQQWAVARTIGLVTTDSVVTCCREGKAAWCQQQKHDRHETEDGQKCHLFRAATIHDELTAVQNKLVDEVRAPGRFVPGHPRNDEGSLEVVRLSKEFRRVSEARAATRKLSTEIAAAVTRRARFFGAISPFVDGVFVLAIGSALVLLFRSMPATYAQAAVVVPWTVPDRDAISARVYRLVGTVVGLPDLGALRRDQRMAFAAAHNLIWVVLVALLLRLPNWFINFRAFESEKRTIFNAASFDISPAVWLTQEIQCVCLFTLIGAIALRQFQCGERLRRLLKKTRPHHAAGADLGHYVADLFPERFVHRSAKMFGLFQTLGACFIVFFGGFLRLFYDLIVTAGDTRYVGAAFVCQLTFLVCLVAAAYPYLVIQEEWRLRRRIALLAAVAGNPDEMKQRVDGTSTLIDQLSPVAPLLRLGTFAIALVGAIFPALQFFIG